MKFNSLKHFDAEIQAKISHYKIHHEMLPFIGEKFEKDRILLISESHYLPEIKMAAFTDVWYKDRSLVDSVQKNHITRVVAGNGSHRLFTNINSVLNKENLNFSSCAWYNFYQKPARHKDSIKHSLSPLDRKVAQETFEDLINILKPKAVIILSKLAFDDLHKVDGKIVRVWDKEMAAHRYKEFNIPLYSIQHPNSAWWNKVSGKNMISGKERFSRALKRLNETLDN